MSVGFIQVNPIPVDCLQNQSKPGEEHRHRGCECQFDTHPTGIGFRIYIIIQFSQTFYSENPVIYSGVSQAR